MQQWIAKSSVSEIENKNGINAKREIWNRKKKMGLKLFVSSFAPLSNWPPQRGDRGNGMYYITWKSNACRTVSHLFLFPREKMYCEQGIPFAALFQIHISSNMINHLASARNAFLKIKNKLFSAFSWESKSVFDSMKLQFRCKRARSETGISDAARAHKNCINFES